MVGTFGTVFFLCRAEGQTQGLVYTKQVLYHGATSQPLIARGSCCFIVFILGLAIELSLSLNFLGNTILLPHTAKRQVPDLQGSSTAASSMLLPDISSLQMWISPCLYNLLLCTWLPIYFVIRIK